MDIKKVFGIGAGLVAATGIVIYIVTNGEPQKYTVEWLKSLSKDMLEKEREFAHNQYLSASDNYPLAVYWERIRDRISQELSKRVWNGHTDYNFPVPSEHGWHLPSDD